MDYLEADSVKVIDVGSGEEMEMKPEVGHCFNGFDFLYFPRYGARLRISLPTAGNIDPKEFVSVIRRGDEPALQELLIKGGIKGDGHVCAEGRISATVLPTCERPSWDRLAMPFVLQTALVRSHREVQDILDRTGLSWHEQSAIFPELTNQWNLGWDAEVGDVNAAVLATAIWETARDSLSSGERALVGDSVDEILNTHLSPSEEQVKYIDSLLESNQSLPVALISLIDRLKMVIPT